MYYSKVQEKDLFGAFFPLENFSLIWRRHHVTGEGLQILTYARHLLSSEGSLACHNYCDTGHPFIIVISDGP